MRQFSNGIPAIVLLVASLTVGGFATATAQDTTPGAPCVGTWLLRVTALGQPASSGFPVTAIFGADGSFVVTSPSVRPGPPDAPDTASFFNPGLGVWEATDTGACAVTHVFYVADAQGNQTNAIEIRLMMVVGPDGDTMEGTDYATVMAPDGTVLASGPGNTVGGTRLVLKLAPSPSPSAAP